MNQDQVKEVLLKVRDDVPEFAVLFSGKCSRRRDGLYHPEKKEIIIHNKNFADDNSLLYTAFHEFAHHIQFTEHEGDHSGRKAHSSLFWHIFHDLLSKAEAAGVYKNIFTTDPRFVALTSDIKKNFLAQNGQLMKDFGKYLIQALDLCQQNHAIFEDYVDRALGMNRNSARSMMKVYAMDVDPDIGFENMKIVAGIKEPQKRKELEDKFKAGSSQAEVKQQIKEEKPDRSVMTLKKLESQRERLEKTLRNIQVKIADLDDEIQKAQEEDV